MKSLLVVLLTFTFSQLFSQDLAISAGLEKTVVGTEFHASSGYVTKKNWSLGAFHQLRIANRTIENTNRQGESWYGLYINMPLATAKKINVTFQVRTGLNEDRFVVVVPAVETTIHLTKLISLGLTSSFRYSYPAFSFKTSIHPFNIGKR